MLGLNGATTGRCMHGTHGAPLPKLFRHVWPLCRKLLWQLAPSLPRLLGALDYLGLVLLLASERAPHRAMRFVSLKETTVVYFAFGDCMVALSPSPKVGRQPGAAGMAGRMSARAKAKAMARPPHGFPAVGLRYYALLIPVQFRLPAG
jgi:hypothetical protein